jgi:uncharacterized protein (TIGR02145 family)
MEEIIIGNQTWMSQNLNVDCYINSVKINQTIFREYENQSSFAEYNYIFHDRSEGDRFYNWYSIIDTNRLVPEGWRIPNTEDWDQLLKNLNERNYGIEHSFKINDKPIKSMDYWSDYERFGLRNDGKGTNETGFNALPLGWFGLEGSEGQYKKASFWCFEDKDNEAYYFELSNKFPAKIGISDKNVFRNIRCIKIT